MKKICLLISLSLFVCLFSVFGETQNTKDNAYFENVKSLKDSFYSYMNFKKNQDLEAIYNILCKESKEKLSFDEFKKTKIGETRNLISYNLESIVDSENEAVIYVNEFFVTGGIPTPRLKVNLSQRWLKEDGGWRLFVEKVDDVQSFMGCGRTAKEAMEMMNSQRSRKNSESPGCGR